MDGQYLDKKNQYLAYLRNWINYVISGEKWKNYEDLHIDEIGSEFNNQREWIPGGMFLLGCLMSLIDRSKFDVILAIPLSCLSTPSPINFTSFGEMEKELDLTPPSFYLFPMGETSFVETINRSKCLYDLSKKEKVQVFYSEKLEHDEVYRTVFVKMQGGEGRKRTPIQNI